MRHYCTYFDHRYLPRGLAMIRSLRRVEPKAIAWVLCLSEECETALNQMAEPGIITINLATLENTDRELAEAKTDRSLIEYYFTCTASLICHVLDQVEANDFVTYVDGDLYFYASPDPLYEALDRNSVSIIPHRFPDSHEALGRYGLYNVGWLTFRKDVPGRAVADWWRARCIEWCYDRLEDDRFADQKYLDRFPNFQGVHVLNHPGANLAPWNLGRHKVTSDQQILVDGLPLLFFHFHGVKHLHGRLYSVPHRIYGAKLTSQLRHLLYRPYLYEIHAIERELAEFLSSVPHKLDRGRKRQGLADQLRGKAIKIIKSIKAVIAGDIVLAPRI